MNVAAGDISSWLNIVVIVLGAFAVVIGVRAKVSELVRAVEKLNDTVERMVTSLGQHETKIALLRQDVDRMMPDGPPRRRGSL